MLSGRTPGLKLSADGRAAAGRLGAALAQGGGIGAVQSSPRERAVQTAEAIAAPLGLAVEIVEALDEVDFGAWQGRSFADLADDTDWDRWNSERATAPTPGGETMAAAVTRARAHLAALPDAATATVCVTHCDIIRGVVADCLGLSLDHMLRFDVDPGSVTTLALGGGAGHLVRLNMAHA